MSTPYRDAGLGCPACKTVMRELQQRLVCDGCDGIMLTEPDLANAIEEMTSVVPTLTWDHDAASERCCPHCMMPMRTCRIVLDLEGAVEHPRIELDRCAHHGVWFDREELAGVLATIIGKGHGGKNVSKLTARRDVGGEDQGRWSAVFPRFGGHGFF